MKQESTQDPRKQQAKVEHCPKHEKIALERKFPENHGK
jgi:hypothetical protein